MFSRLTNRSKRDTDDEKRQRLWNLQRRQQEEQLKFLCETNRQENLFKRIDFDEKKNHIQKNSELGSPKKSPLAEQVVDVSVFYPKVPFMNHIR